ncbi:hypothetical protein C1752_02278 [Acaryochloris thomasi RCC1774]|uniref:Uncharacterized protein n=1 Tax=Acaryochloris thomasi RCC1774 TaxID=1764569 RepID=A0A2W1JR01_9CYAN|nr:hypothetical protein [Acaryochloris thomasi]PZD73272.1 hypothetical protein C1752_02278 [Acaryochloris thomasi RCC1774]
MNKNRLTQRLIATAGMTLIGLASFGLVSKAGAVGITGGSYTLDNHPDGSASSPFYGLRLDGLLSGKSKDIYTFNFTEGGASVALDYDDTSNTINISGTAYGGLDQGDSYSAPELFSINFTYRNVQQVAGDDDLWVDGSQAGSSTGTITRQTSGDVYNLADFSGANAYSFRLGDGDNNQGHRGHQGISGWGWLNHAPADQDPSLSPHLYSSDWLFTAQSKPAAVPESPLTAGALALLVGGFIALKRKQRIA